MTKKITIIGSISEEDGIEALCSRFKEMGINAEALYSDVVNVNKNVVLKAVVAILWISSKSQEKSFEIANERKAKGLITINYFADAVALTETQKKAIGSNKSVFAELNPEESVRCLINLVNTESVEILNVEDSITRPNTVTSNSEPPACSNNLETTTRANIKAQISTKVEHVSQITDKPSTDDSDSGELPVYEDLENSNSSGYSMKKILIIVVLAFVTLAIGQRLNWWNIEFLSWVNGNPSQEAVAVDTSMLEEPIPSEDEIAVENKEVVEEVIEVNEPYTVHLTGTIGGKYPIELILDGDRKEDGFYPVSGKYRYTKYGDSWIQLHGETESVDNAISYIKILEYSDGELSGTWNVRYDMSNNTLSGYMSNSNGEAYSVSVSDILKSESSNEVVTDSII